MKQFKNPWVAVIFALVLGPVTEAQERKATKMKEPAEQVPVVIFVCEHGSAKSVVAAAHFNRLSKEGNLKLRAISRGTNPDKELPANTLKGLKGDGLAADELEPRKISQGDLAGAVRIITFCQLPEVLTNLPPVESWEDAPPMSEDYGRFRDLVVARIRRLLNELRSAK